MITKKVCMLGAFSVGKTSLIKRYVSSVFDEKYHTTIGVKIDKKTVSTEQGDVQLMLWDLEGSDAYTDIKKTYLRGASGIVIVVDATREKSVSEAIDLYSMIKNEELNCQMAVLINKIDLLETSESSDNSIDHFKQLGISIFKTSAKTGLNVEDAFVSLTESMLAEN